MRDLGAAKRLSRKMLNGDPLLAPTRSAQMVQTPSHRRSKRRLTMGFSILPGG